MDKQIRKLGLVCPMLTAKKTGKMIFDATFGS